MMPSSGCDAEGRFVVPYSHKVVCRTCGGKPQSFQTRNDMPGGPHRASFGFPTCKTCVPVEWVISLDTQSHAGSTLSEVARMLRGEWMQACESAAQAWFNECGCFVPVLPDVPAREEFFTSSMF